MTRKFLFISMQTKTDILLYAKSCTLYSMLCCTFIISSIYSSVSHCQRHRRTKRRDIPLHPVIRNMNWQTNAISRNENDQNASTVWHIANLAIRNWRRLRWRWKEDTCLGVRVYLGTMITFANGKRLKQVPSNRKHCNKRSLFVFNGIIQDATFEIECFCPYQLSRWSMYGCCLYWIRAVSLRRNVGKAEETSLDFCFHSIIFLSRNIPLGPNNIILFRGENRNPGNPG